MMKKNEKRKNSTMKKLIPAAGMLALSASMLATSTYAWFTMNKQVSVTGMEVHTKVSSNLLICTTNLDADYSSNTLIQARRALLEPVSSINGTTSKFFYTTDAKANGAKNQATSVTPYVAYNEGATGENLTAGKGKYDAAFNTAYSIQATGTEGAYKFDGTEPAYGYVDYIFYLKATSDQANQAINMTECDLDYNGDEAAKTDGTDGIDNDEAWRVAVFAYDVTAAKPGNGLYTATDIADVAGNQVGLISLPGAGNQTDGKAVSTTTETDTVANAAATNGVIIGTIGDANVTKYYKVVVRLWLEGEDKTCTSRTYADLTENYSLDMKFELGQGTAVKNLTTHKDYEAPTEAGKTQTGTQYDASFGA